MAITAIGPAERDVLSFAYRKSLTPDEAERAFSLVEHYMDFLGPDLCPDEETALNLICRILKRSRRRTTTGYTYTVSWRTGVPDTLL